MRRSKSYWKRYWDEQEGYFTLKETAGRLKVSVRTLYRYIRDCLYKGPHA